MCGEVTAIIAAAATAASAALPPRSSIEVPAWAARWLAAATAPVGAYRVVMQAIPKQTSRPIATHAYIGI